MRLLIAIVNYRTAALVVDCLRSLAPEVAAIAGARVSLVDNASGDDSVGVLRAAIAANGWDAWCDLRALPRNGGFAYGNNEAIAPYRAARPEHVWLLNPDTVVRPGAAQALLDHLDAHPEAGIAGSRTEDPDGAPQSSAFRFPSIAGEFEAAARLGLASRLLGRWVVPMPPGEHAAAVDWVSGASLMVRGHVLDAVGLLDEGYFMYFEEVDLCLRARRAGFASCHVAASRVVHLIGGASGITAAAPERRRPAYWFDSRRRYFVKNHGRGYAALADLAHLAGHLSWRVRRVIQRKPRSDPQRYLGDFVRHSVLAGRAA